MKKIISCVFSALMLSVFVLPSLTAQAHFNEDGIPVGIDIATGEEFIPILGEHEGVFNLSPTMRINELYGRGSIELMTTAPTIVYLGPFTSQFRGSILNGFVARTFPPSQNLEAAARRAVLNRWGTIGANNTYTIRWTNRVVNRPTSSNGSIVNVTAQTRRP